MGFPNGDGPSYVHVPYHHPSFGIGGDETRVLLEKVDGVDWSGVAAEDVTWTSGAESRGSYRWRLGALALKLKHH